MRLADVEKLLRDAIGLHVETVGASVVDYALKQRMSACRITSPSDYWRLVAGSREELQELINAVVVPETWFFRDREAFAALVGHARANRRLGVPVRILSLPCSTGEEPYSMAMAMFDGGFGTSDFSIDAIDVSTRNISEAVRAIYGRNSFRGADLAFRDRHFEPVDGGYRPRAAVLKQVKFAAGNLFDPGSAGLSEAYDVVFCRNLLIYFDRELQQRALERLHRLLSPNGLLVVGPAESGLPMLHGFASAKIAMAFAFIKQTATAPAGSAPTSSSRSAAGPDRVRRRATLQLRSPAAHDGAARGTVPVSPQRPIRPPTASPAAPAVSAPPEDPAALSFAAIERAADAGRIEETKQAARTHIEKFGPSPGVFYLLGLAHDAGNATAAAVENYRKALYLAPDHRETLAHLALLLQRQGDVAGAKALRSRLLRIENRSGIG